MFGHALGLVLLGKMGSSCLHHLFAFVIPFPLVVGEISSDGLVGWKGGKPILGGLPPD